MSTPTAVPADTVTAAPPGPRLLRLRPVVHASPVAGGLHVRGWTSSFTVDGGPGLWRLWQMLAATLADGADPARLAAPAGSEQVRAAVATVLGQLREHDMLVEVPAGWGMPDQPGGPAPDPSIARWLESVAADPARAWARLNAAEVTVTGGGRVAAAAVRALAAAGVTVHRRAGGDRGRAALHGSILPGEIPDGPSTVHVLAGADGDAGFAGPVTDDGPGGTDPIAARLRLAAIDGPDAETPVLAALVGGVAAHRLVCAVAGLPDPGADTFAHVAPGPATALGHPTVFVARLDPLRGAYHPWLGDGDPTARPGHRASEPLAGGRLDRAIALADALTDPELGPLPPVRISDLPQVPAGLVAVPAPTGTTVGVGVTVDVARLLAVLGAVEQVIDGSDGPLAVGADRCHADGVALRRLAHHTRTGHPLGDGSWSGSAVARQWWKALTLRLGVPARVVVTRLADGIHHASVEAAGTEQAGAELAWAVEADPADAVAFALLHAVGSRQWHDATAESSTVFAPCGATPAPPTADRARVPWHGGAWAWPAPLADAEPALQAGLRRWTGATPRVVTGGLPAAVAATCVVVRTTR